MNIFPWLWLDFYTLDVHTTQFYPAIATASTFKWRASGFPAIPANSQKTFKILKNNTHKRKKNSFPHRIHNNYNHVNFFYVEQFINNCRKVNTLYKNHFRYCIQTANRFFAAKYKILKNAPRQPFIVFTTKHKILNTVPK